MTILGFHISFFQVFATVIGIGFLVFIHELGHFLMAKRFRVRVEKFTFGFGPELIGYTYGETRYSICAIPLGGMVKMPGENPEDASGSPGEFMSLVWYRRMGIALMGPLMNYFLAIILFMGVIYFWGLTKPVDKPFIGEVVADYPAQKAGLAAGDRVTAVNGVPVATWNDMAQIIHASAEKEVRLQVMRADAEIQLTLIPKKDPASGSGIIGIAPQFETEKVGLGSAALMSVKLAAYQSIFTLRYLGEKLTKGEKPELAGPIGVVQMISKAAKTGWADLLYLLAVISVALGLFNLLPIPLVDGGHIFVALIEGVIRRPVNEKIIQVANVCGFALLIMIFVYATYSDVVRLAVGK